MLDEKFAKIEAQGDKIRDEKREEIEDRRREVKENLERVKWLRERIVSTVATESSV